MMMMMMIIIIMKTFGSYINSYAKTLLYFQLQVCCVAGCDVAK